MKKYILLFNIDEELEATSNEYSDVVKFIGNDNCVFEHYQMYHFDGEELKKYEGRSIWVTQEYYILAWCLANYEFLRECQEEGYEDDFKLDRANKWLEMHLENQIYTIEK